MTHCDARACHTRSVTRDEPLRKQIGVTAALEGSFSLRKLLPKRSPKAVSSERPPTPPDYGNVGRLATTVLSVEVDASWRDGNERDSKGINREASANTPFIRGQFRDRHRGLPTSSSKCKSCTVIVSDNGQPNLCATSGGGDKCR